jgi:hypothetical protein
MAFVFTAYFTADAEARMKRFYDSLSEKDARRYAAVEASKLGHGGIEYVAQVLGCSRRTIERASDEVEILPEDPAQGRVRRPGGGRKKKSTANHSSK